MKAFIASVAFALVVAVGASLVLEQQQQSAAARFPRPAHASAIPGTT